jgi:signal transduction histidine kinase
MALLSWLADTSGLTPHGFCLTWEPALIWLDCLADGLTMLSYFSIPLALLWFMRRRRDLPRRWVGGLFAGFILACGTTHGMAILTLFVPAYNLEAATKLATAVLSLATAVTLWPLVPRLLTVPSTAQLAESNRELALVNQELEAFSYSISHDLRAPLRAINGYARILVADFARHLPADAVAHLDAVVSSSQRMGALIDALLGFARLGRLPLARATVDPAELARQVVAELRPGWAGRRIEIDVAQTGQHAADPGLLRLVYQNLIDNAVKYTRTRAVARIRIGMRPGPAPQDGPVFFVADNGVGFDMRYADRLFGVFQRLHAEGEFDGTGVGLATAQRIVQRHGGRIWAEAAPDAGATFCFTLGAAAATPRPADAPVRSAA